MKNIELINDIISMCIEQDLDVHIRSGVIKISTKDKWKQEHLEAFIQGDSSKLRFMNYVPLKELKSEITKLIK